MSGILPVQNFFAEEIARIHEMEEVHRPLRASGFGEARSVELDPEWVSPREKELREIARDVKFDFAGGRKISAPRLFYYQSLVTGLLLEKRLDEIEGIPSKKGVLGKIRRQLQELRKDIPASELSEEELQTRTDAYRTLDTQLEQTALLRGIDLRTLMYSQMSGPVGVVDRITNAVIGLTVFAESVQSEGQADFLRMKRGYERAMELWEAGKYPEARQAFLDLEADPKIPEMLKEYEFAEVFQNYGINTGLILAAGFTAGWSAGALGLTEVAAGAEAMTASRTVLSLGVRASSFVAVHRSLEEIVTGQPTLYNRDQSVSRNAFELAEEMVLTAGMFAFIGEAGKIYQGFAGRQNLALAQSRLVEAGSPLTPQSIATELAALSQNRSWQGLLATGAFGTELGTFGAWDETVQSYQGMKHGNFSFEQILANLFSGEIWKHRALSLLALKAGGKAAEPLNRASFEYFQELGKKLQTLTNTWEFPFENPSLAALGPFSLTLPTPELQVPRPIYMTQKGDGGDSPKAPLREESISIHSPSEMGDIFEKPFLEDVLNSNRNFLQEWRGEVPKPIPPSQPAWQPLIQDLGIQKAVVHFSPQGRILEIRDFSKDRPKDMGGVWTTVLLGPKNEILWYNPEAFNDHQASHHGGKSAMENLWNHTQLLRRRFFSQHTLAVQLTLLGIGIPAPAFEAKLFPEPTALAAADFFEILEKAEGSDTLRLWCYRDNNQKLRVWDEFGLTGDLLGKIEISLKWNSSGLQDLEIQSAEFINPAIQQNIREMFGYLGKQLKALSPPDITAPTTLNSNPPPASGPFRWKPTHPSFQWDNAKQAWVLRIRHGKKGIALSSEDFELPPSRPPLDIELTINRRTNHYTVTSNRGAFFVSQGDENVYTLVKRHTQVHSGDRILLGKDIEFIIE